MHALDEAQKFVDVFVDHGFKQIDTARLYGNGTAEEVRRLQRRNLYRTLIIASPLVLGEIGPARLFR